MRFLPLCLLLFACSSQETQTTVVLPSGERAIWVNCHQEDQSGPPECLMVVGRFCPNGYRLVHSRELPKTRVSSNALVVVCSVPKEKDESDAQQ